MVLRMRNALDPAYLAIGLGSIVWTSNGVDHGEQGRKSHSARDQDNRGRRAIEEELAEWISYFDFVSDLDFVV